MGFTDEYRKNKTPHFQADFWELDVFAFVYAVAMAIQYVVVTAI
jgi:hypothetical protein